MGSIKPPVSRATSRYNCHEHCHNMGTKLSKANAKEGGAKEAVADKSATLPPAITEKKETDEDLAAKSETLPRNAFDRSSSFSKRFRKSMTKFVGKKKGNKEAPEEKVEKATEEATTEQINIEQEKEGDFKTTQQKARADFFKEMYTADEKIDVVADVEKEENNVESEDKETKNEEDEKLNVSLIGTPEITPEEELKKTVVEEENLPEKIVEEVKQEIKTEDADDELHDQTPEPETITKPEEQQVALEEGQETQETEKESSDEAVKCDTANEVEDVQSVTTAEPAEEEKSDDTKEQKSEEEHESEEPSDAEEENTRELEEATKDEIVEVEKEEDNQEENVESDKEDQESNDGSGAESLDSKSDDIEDTESEEGVTTDEGIAGSDEDTVETEDIKKPGVTESIEQGHCDIITE